MPLFNHCNPMNVFRWGKKASECVIVPLIFCPHCRNKHKLSPRQSGSEHAGNSAQRLRNRLRRFEHPGPPRERCKGLKFESMDNSLSQSFRVYRHFRIPIPSSSPACHPPIASRRYAIGRGLKAPGPVAKTADRGRLRPQPGSV